MRTVIQRVSRASVSVDGSVVGTITHGLLVLLGLSATDTTTEVDWMIDKLLTVRLFPDDAGKMNLSVVDVSGGLLIVSQFTLYGDLRKGTRPSFIQAAGSEIAEPLYNDFLVRLRQRVTDVSPGTTIASGVFGAKMDVELVNDGPVTLVIDREHQRSKSTE
ncbi:MAG TPA: D-tyrosyl-tRNA(Tyr) deacylase [Bacteroidetes bacterium]|nr:D-tyrosyl-tRNA(Tyr) deacylase [Bacteroidota bacterium]HRK03688.1 D-aminoacyl-tRNA deacylase [Chlorobiota bacterium]